MNSQPPHLAQVLTALIDLTTDVGWHDLRAELPDPTDTTPVRLGFVGPHNAGKSTLIAALTGDLSVKRDAKPETVVASHHPWHDCVLVDLPGLFSGFVEHDEVAETVIRRDLDVVIFTMTVELGDEQLAETAARVFQELEFERRGLVVVNKANSEENLRGVVLEEVRGRIGDVIPVHFTDAQDFLETLEHDDYDDDEVEVLRSGSGIPALADELDALAQRWCREGRALAQSAQARRVAEEGLSRLTPGDDEVAAMDGIAALNAAVDAAASQLDLALQSRMTELESAVGLIGERVMKLGPELSHIEHNTAWTEAIDKPLEALTNDADRVLISLLRDFDDMVVTLERFEAAEPGRVPDGGEVADDDGPSWIHQARKKAGVSSDKISGSLADRFRQIADAGAGKESEAYEWAGRAQPWKKFKPYGRLKDAQKVRVGARFAEKGVPIATAALSELLAWRADLKARSDRDTYEKETRATYASAGAKERDDQTATFNNWKEEALAPFEKQIVALREPWDVIAESRNEIASRLQAVLIALEESAASPTRR